MLALSHYQVSPILQAIKQGKDSALTSSDLGVREIEVAILPDKIIFPDSSEIRFETLNEIFDEKNGCFLLQNCAAKKIQMYSETTGRFYSLCPTEQSPTLLVSGKTMHRIVGTNPTLDTKSKIKTITPIRGRVLDTCMGLGYTAIEASKTADEVVTIEFDKMVEEICHLNPWSEELFSNSKIKRRIGNSFEEIKTFDENYFDFIIHDPPMFALAGELYSEEFYREAFRVLKKRGKMFHY
ncbi:MAG: methyltransferase, partial [Ignavibacteria bacterium]|nr:methyltransferase [Ignavibacteria bacterium]